MGGVITCASSTTGTGSDVMVAGARTTLLLGLNLVPNRRGRISDAVFGHAFPRHRGQHVIIFIECLRPVPAELALHGERNQQLSAHQTQTVRLHRFLIVKVEDADGLALPDPPRASAGLPESVQRVTGLKENRGGGVQQI